ncbi:SMI1/KNR4 family protein [Tengunoibacter tsumagoiensis]|uniref:Knr4/Smi1-like domain-containing protein n=1 Tax=Tengunoibacter tsumagoiensis TaxID=2014871 RepID=A0A401ZY93_9CHLR|nr:SMI1/KNR4 family protein [Tengunoibacter tsumagoiensis]GCE11826.1 hypothetical protein KTT_16850 [Tengunoibacter tsumagoiensis]
MDENDQWRKILQSYRAQGVQAVSLAEPEAEKLVRALVVGEPLPPAVASFIRLWLKGSGEPWQILIQSASVVHAGVKKELGSGSLLEPLRALIQRVVDVAILCWPPTPWYPSQRWGYLFQVKALQAEKAPKQIVLHTPASLQDIAQAEAALRLTLPPSYRRFLLVTNGFATGVHRIPWICGAGPGLANWKSVLFNKWSDCEGYHEIASLWRAFQGIYDYERIRDWENGENTFLSDETVLVPFAQTYDEWCFDRSRRKVSGEYPVIFWNHETRQASDYYKDFSSWFAGEVELFLFGT